MTDIAERETLSWLPCQHPERPIDRHMGIHLVPCTGCRVTLEAWIAREPERPTPRKYLELIDQLAENKSWHTKAPTSRATPQGDTP